MMCAIMQPTYLPWSGYFGMIAAVDVFVLLDDVQYERRSWQSRNRIRLGDKEHFLTVPTKKAAQSALINSILLDEQGDWRATHIATLQHAYAKHPWGPQVIAVIEEALGQRDTHLADLNIRLIEALSRFMGLRTPLARASSLRCCGKRSEHLALICQAMNCDTYLAPPGSLAYLQEDLFEQSSGLKLRVHSFESRPYPQEGKGDFVSHLSVVDLLANCSPADARNYVWDGLGD